MERKTTNREERITSYFTEVKKETAGISCRNCILEIAGECVGCSSACDCSFYRPSPRNVIYYH